jgi:hypothetical protein
VINRICVARESKFESKSIGDESSTDTSRKAVATPGCTARVRDHLTLALGTRAGANTFDARSANTLSARAHAPRADGGEARG